MLHNNNELREKERLHFDKTNQYCGVCGAPTREVAWNQKQCTQCGRDIFPSINPAAIVLVERGDEILLVHARTFRDDHYGLVAGFVEMGESAEECIERELMEEVGIKVTDLKFFGTQAWPSPSVLMIGFTAKYLSGEIRLQEEELTDGAFFNINNLPKLPRETSIAYKLIMDFCRRHQ